MKRTNVSILLALMIGMMALTGCGNSDTQQASAEQSKEETEAPEQTAAPETQEKTEADAAADTGATNTETAMVEEPGELTAEFDPNSDYDKYTLVYYVVEDIDARFVATVSAMGDGSAYEVHCSVDGEEQIVTLDKDMIISSDKTGNMSYDAPLIVQKAIDADNWTEIDQE